MTQQIFGHVGILMYAQKDCSIEVTVEEIPPYVPEESLLRTPGYYRVQLQIPESQYSIYLLTNKEQLLQLVEDLSSAVQDVTDLAH